MTWRVAHPRAQLAEAPRARTIVEKIDGWLWIHVKPECESLLDDGAIEKVVGLMQTDRRAGCGLGAADTGNVIHVRVGQQDVDNAQPMPPGGLEQQVDLVAGIDNHAFLRSFAAEHVAVFHERLDGPRLQNHRWAPGPV